MNTKTWLENVFPMALSRKGASKATMHSLLHRVSLVD